jgi:hypothetical protein
VPPRPSQGGIYIDDPYASEISGNATVNANQVLLTGSELSLESSVRSSASQYSNETYAQFLPTDGTGSGTAHLNTQTLTLDQNSSMDIGGSIVTVTDITLNAGVMTLRGADALLDTGTYMQTATGAMGLEGGTLDPDSIQIDGGYFGGDGSVIGNFTMSGGELQAGDTQGNLSFTGDFTQTGGEIVFDVYGNGSGGFDWSMLTFDGTDPVSIANTDVVFDFLDGASEQEFLADGLFNLDNFFGLSGGGEFGSVYDLANVFQDDQFSTGDGGESFTGFDPLSGDLAQGVGQPPSSTPDSGSTMLLLATCLAALAVASRRRFRLQ